MHDFDASRTSTRYECLRCGDLVTAESHPGNCEECSGTYQNHAVSLE